MQMKSDSNGYEEKIFDEDDNTNDETVRRRTRTMMMRAARRTVSKTIGATWRRGRQGP